MLFSAKKLLAWARHTNAIKSTFTLHVTVCGKLVYCQCDRWRWSKCNQFVLGQSRL